MTCEYVAEKREQETPHEQGTCMYHKTQHASYDMLSYMILVRRTRILVPLL